MFAWAKKEVTMSSRTTTSKSKTSIFGGKGGGVGGLINNASKTNNSTSTTTTNKSKPPSVEASSSSTNISAATKRVVSMLSSFPFRYALASDGCTTTTSNSARLPASPKQPPPPPSTTSKQPSLLINSSSSHDYSKLVSSFSATTNGSSLESMSRQNHQYEENAFIKKESISSLEMDTVGGVLNKSSTSPSSSSPKTDDDNDAVFFVQTDYDNEDVDKFKEERFYNDENEEEKKRCRVEKATAVTSKATNGTNNFVHDLFQSESSFFNLFATTLPPRLSNTADSYVSYSLKKYAVRRHHSAPQSDSKWAQVEID